MNQHNKKRSQFRRNQRCISLEYIIERAAPAGYLSLNRCPNWRIWFKPNQAWAVTGSGPGKTDSMFSFKSTERNLNTSICVGIPYFHTRNAGNTYLRSSWFKRKPSTASFWENVADYRPSAKVHLFAPGFLAVWCNEFLWPLIFNSPVVWSTLLDAVYSNFKFYVKMLFSLVTFSVHSLFHFREKNNEFKKKLPASACTTQNYSTVDRIENSIYCLHRHMQTRNDFKAKSMYFFCITESERWLRFAKLCSSDRKLCK